MLTAQDLIDFEEEISKSFANKEIRSPIHLYSGNEEQIIDIFNTYVKATDWVVCTWRSHYQCLLHGISKERLKNAILDNRSISLCFPQERIFSSAIVGGSIPIALGIALDIQRNEGTNQVVCFVGDMTSQCGIFSEALEYAANFKLPILFVVEDNNKSVCTPTRTTWGSEVLMWETLPEHKKKYVVGYYYESKFPHAGGLQRVQF